MYSYPNYIPLPARAVQHAVKAVEPYAFDRVYGAWWHTVIADDAKNVIAASTSRYLQAISTGYP
jgi:hypothetical protein